MSKPTIKKKTTKKVKLDIHEKEKKLHIREVTNIFTKSGFIRVPSVSDKLFTFKGRSGDIDDVFIIDNIIVFLEYTTSITKNISDHLLKKKIIFDHIQENHSEFLEFFTEKFETFKNLRDENFTVDQCKLVILYASKHEVNQVHKDQLPNIHFLDYPIVKYFKNVTDAVKQSAKYELFKFLNLKYSDIGVNLLSVSSTKIEVNGSVLPESHSNFDKGFKVVSFYIDPNTLLKKSYVLRKDSWRIDDGSLYQRMISNKKIVAIRKHLYTQKRVFINNIIVTLPSETKLLDNEDNTIDPNTLVKTKPAVIRIPDDFNIIGLIDGQHRVFAYHEGGENDTEIKKLREKQNLLVTGIIYPAGISNLEKAKFEAKLFLEINSTQTNANSSLKQAIELILNPFSSESIAKAVVNKLNNDGALEDKFERPFFDKDKIKITSIVSYGLKPIVKLSGNDSLFKIWTKEGKESLSLGLDENLLKEYVEFCKDQINDFFAAFQKNIPKDRWSTDKDSKNKVLTSTIINGLIICLRKIIEENKNGDFNFYDKKFKNISAFDLSSYKSSQWSALGLNIYRQHF